MKRKKPSTILKFALAHNMIREYYREVNGLWAICLEFQYKKKQDKYGVKVFLVTRNGTIDKTPKKEPNLVGRLFDISFIHGICIEYFGKICMRPVEGVVCDSLDELIEKNIAELI